MYHCSQTFQNITIKGTNFQTFLRQIFGSLNITAISVNQIFWQIQIQQQIRLAVLAGESYAAFRFQVTSYLFNHIVGFEMYRL